MKKLYELNKKRKNDFIQRLKKKEEQENNCNTPVPINNGFGWSKIYTKWQEQTAVDRIDDQIRVYPINHLLYSTGSNYVIGNKFINKRCLVSGVIYRNPNGVLQDIDEHVLVALVYDKCWTGSIPALSDIFGFVYGTSPCDDSYAAIGWENPLNSDRFTILKSERFHYANINATIPTGSNPLTNALRYVQSGRPGKIAFEWDVDCMDLPTQNKTVPDEPLTAPQITHGCLFVCWVGLNTAYNPFTQSQLQMKEISRLYFEDN